MNWWREFESRIQRDAPLGRLTWFRVGGPARLVFRPHDARDLGAMVTRARSEGVPIKVLGSGANVLVSDDGFDGVVVRLDGPAFSHVEQNGNTVRVGAGVDLMPLARRCSEEGLSGLEGLAGIPATVGGAVRMNAGGRFGDFGSAVDEVEVLRSDGSIAFRSKRDMGFGYRRSEIGDDIVVSAVLELRKDDPRRTKKRFDECFEYKKSSQPLAEHSAGCIFKNPPEGSAGAMIDRAGLKGRAYRGARVSDRHANFIITDRGATASDVLGLIELVRERVARVFDTLLELEIDVWRPTTH